MKKPTPQDCSREAFEKWISTPPFEMTIERRGEESTWYGSYKDINVDLAWQAWQESAKRMTISKILQIRNPNERTH